ncbi:MAG: hypothetical protein JRJ60_12135 [Deltaproteobacteria bacterium]|nr:hypothetical protein [Deltaproteobacteria bacterium]
MRPAKTRWKYRDEKIDKSIFSHWYSHRCRCSALGPASRGLADLHQVVYSLVLGDLCALSAAPALWGKRARDKISCNILPVPP